MGGTALRLARVGTAIALLSLAGPARADDAGVSPALPGPKVNQIGYLPDAVKTLHVTVGAGAAPGDPVSVVDSTGHEVWSGSLSAAAVDDTASTGESVVSADISNLTLPGTYVARAGGTASPSFTVGPAIYDALYRDALRTFYLIRCGVAISDDETGIRHAACHTADAVLRDAGAKLDLTGGWHNAGDFGKWTHEASIAASLMMWLAELDPHDVLRVDAGTPESTNNVPDLLDEARWGLSWLLKMAQADGSVLHKVDTEPNFAWGLPPESDPYTRRAGLASTIDAADFTAVMLQASRVFRDRDATFAADCAEAARRSWSWVEANPSIGEPDVYYTDPDPSQELVWATGEMLRAGHDAQVQAEWSTRASAAPPAAVTWLAPQALGYLAVAMDPSGEPTVVANAKSALDAFGRTMVSVAGSTGYGVVTGPAEYFWESNETLLGKAVTLLFAHTVTQTDAYRNLALGQLDWILGDNALGRSFVTGYGSLPVQHPYHWTYHALNKLMPGWAAGGPNDYDAGVDTPLLEVIERGTPPAKCYVDEGDALGSWASNEGEVVENALLLFAAGYFTSAPPADAGGGGGIAAPPADAGGDGGTAAPSTPRSGCGCSLTPRPLVTGWIAAVLLLAATALRRRAARARVACPPPTEPARYVAD